MPLILSSLLTSLMNLLYPPICLHCRETKENPSLIFCKSCANMLQLIDPSQRCPLCFSVDVSSREAICQDCLQSNPPLNGLASAFDYLGPAATLIRHLKYADQPYLAKGIGGYLAAQFLRLGWPLPDLVVPIPLAFTHWLNRGYNQSELIGKHFCEILDIPFEDILKRKSGDYSQAGLSKKQRLALGGEKIYLKRREKLYDKRILLIDDVMTTGTTLRRCAETLMEDCPSAIYGLTVCRSIH